MKHFLVLTVFASILFAFTACEKDADSKFSKSDIQGKWNVTQFNGSGAWEVVPARKMYAKFSKDNRYNSKFNSSTYSGTWTLSGNIITCNVSGAFVTYTILYMKGKTGTFEVKEPGFKPYSVKATKE